MTDHDARPVCVDLFCKAGGAGEGYHRAGYRVVGVDIEVQPHYPFEFYRGDAFDMLPRLLAAMPVALIHASPPCQAYSMATPERFRVDAPALVEPTRALLKESGKPYIMENVALAPLELPVMLCGTMFGLGAFVNDEWRQLRRHRFFESSELLSQPGPCRHSGNVVGVYGRPGGTDRKRGVVLAGTDQWAQAMGIDWMSGSELTQAVPPIFTQHLGGQILNRVDVSA